MLHATAFRQDKNIIFHYPLGKKIAYRAIPLSVKIYDCHAECSEASQNEDKILPIGEAKE